MTNPSQLPSVQVQAWSRRPFQQKALIVALIALLAAAFLWVNLATSLSVAPWVDEVQQVDAGINLHLGKGWVSTAWHHESQYQFYAANVPFYTYLIAGWVSLVGIAPVAVRSMNYLLAFVIAWLIPDACRRKGLVTALWARILLAVLIVTDQTVAYVYRMGRADLLTMLSVAALFWIYCSVESPVRRRALLFLFAMPLIASGLHAIPYIVLLLVLEFLASRKVHVPEIVAVASGCAVGGVLTGLIFYLNHALMEFVTETFAAGYNILGTILQVILIHDNQSRARLVYQLKELSPVHVLSAICGDHSLLPLIAFFLLVAVLFYRNRERSKLRWLAIFGLITTLLIPYGLFAAGRYNYYNRWTGAAPVLVVFIILLQQCWMEEKRKLLITGVVAAILSIVLGMPSSIWVERHQAGPEAYGQLAQILQQEVRSGDELYGDPALYYLAKEQGIPYYANTYAGGRSYRHISDAEASRLTLMIIPPDHFDGCVSKVGDRWSRGRTYTLDYGFQLEVWRRLPITASLH